MLYIKFIISSALIVAAGVRLTSRADVLADRLGICKVWVGIILLGFITSLPEAVTSLTAIITLQAKDLAIGNMLGSDNFNIMLIVLMDILFIKESITNKIGFNRNNVIPALFTILIVSIAMLEILVTPKVRVGHVSLGSLLILITYISAVIFSKQPVVIDKSGSLKKEAPGKGTKLNRVFLEVLISAIVVVLSSIWLTNISEAIAGVSGLGRTFVGTTFLAIATSLPEMVVTVSALKIGALGLAVGNIFGSNIINIFILFLCDLFFPQGFILEDVSRAHIITASLNIALTCVFLLGLRMNNKKTFLRLGFDSWIMLFLFSGGLIVLYHLK